MAQEPTFACRVDGVPQGRAKIIELKGRSIGIFRVEDEFCALLNVCPHRGAALCEGPVSGTTAETQDRSFLYGRRGEIVRCSWHGWEFDIRTGAALVDPKVRARTYRVEIEDDDLYVVI